MQAEHPSVLIVDDSAVARAVIARIVDATDRFVVARTVATVAAALEFLATQRVEFIFLDIEMPGVDGLTALPDLIAAGQGAKVVMVSSAAREGAVATVQALALGAAHTIEKPAPGAPTSRFAAALLETLLRLADGGAPAPAPVPAPHPVAPSVMALPPVRPGHDDYDVVAIGASTGGIHALSHLLRALPAGFRLPIIITQHLPATFMPHFAAQVAVLAGRPCEVAVDRLRVRPGRVIVAPGDAHIRCVGLADGSVAVRLATEPAASGCMPSVDPMFASMAAVYGPRMLAVVLSGMGRDGADGARAVRQAGGAIVVQDQASSVIWGMPGAVVATGCFDAILPPATIGALAATRRRP